MSVVNVVPGITGQAGQQSSADGRTFQETRTQPYTVLLSSATDTLDTIYAHPDVPAIGSSMLGMPWFRCTSRAPRRINPVYWEITVTWTADSKPGEQPIDLVPRIDRRFIWAEEAIDRDADGAPIRTINRESYDGITERFPIYVYDVRRNVATFNDLTWRAAMNKVNSGPWGPFGPGEVLLFDAACQEVVTPDYVYFSVRAEFHTKDPATGATAAQTWWKRILHQGYYVNILGSPPNQLTAHALDDEGSKVTKPVLLDEQGKQTKTPLWKFVKSKGSTNFGSLGII